MTVSRKLFLQKNLFIQKNIPEARKIRHQYAVALVK